MARVGVKSDHGFSGGWWVALGVFGIDQLARLAVARFWTDRLVLNTGGVFHIGRNLSPYFWAIVGLSLIGLVYHFFWPRTSFGSGLIIGGLLSQAVSRLVEGGVADYLGLPLFGVVSLSDLSIVAGVAIVVFDSFRRGRKPDFPT